MNIEDKLKDLILSRYHSISEFSRACNIPNSTLNTILTRGIGTGTLSNVLKVCERLHISADALAEGRIEDNYRATKTADVDEILQNTKHQLLNNQALMFNGKPADAESIQSILDAMELGMELARRKMKK